MGSWANVTDQIEYIPMKILAITALYKPHHLGGCHIRWWNVLERLRGHHIGVLASTYGVKQGQVDSDDT
jgi:hypothetical protein